MSRWSRREALLIAREGSVDEAKALISSLDVDLLDVIVLKNTYRPDRNTYLGRGKLEGLRNTYPELSPDRSVLYVYDRLYPRQIINLMKALKTDVKDKVGLILEIFAVHAGSKEAKLQIEMAEILHTMPLIKEWIRKAKMKELPGYMGPGRYAVDAYYTHMKSRLARIRRELAKLRERRGQERRSRARRGMPHVAIGGYANAGKTTLFNALTDSEKPTGPEMFTTLSPKIKAAMINGSKIAFVDTVGFIRDIPHEVIEAFYATLEQISTSDLTILVIDSSEPPENTADRLRSSLDILRRIGYVGKPLITVLNKEDLNPVNTETNSRIAAEVLSSVWPWRWRIVKVSALQRKGLEALKDAIVKELVKPPEEERTVTSRYVM